MKKIVFLFSLLPMLGCTSKNNYYKKSDIRVLEINPNSKSIAIYYYPKAETMFNSTGVDYKYNNVSKQIDIYFVRQKINTENKAMTPSSLLRDLNDRVRIEKYGAYCYIVEIPLQKHWSNLNKKAEMIKIID
ncbi:MAG: hypothetical protein ACK5MD_04200 [Flavobacteriales bacterium]